MKKIIISTALALTPSSLQSKALCKALNYIFAHHELSKFNHKIINIKVNGLKKSWSVIHQSSTFRPIKSREFNLEVSIDFDTAINLQNKEVILAALHKGQINFEGEHELITAMTRVLSNLDDKRLSEISERLFSFLKIKNESKKIDIKTVTLKDLKNKNDVDFIRDAAVKLEKTNLPKALSLMLLAQQARPNGPFINNKVLQYKTLLFK
ncbi:hypothetical protein [uncultured Psychromonas sp.]|uniref:hypothetical protein n=1 Tax=uncultured Psychromonas sp. TaxID=173974 RepID=UPI002639CEAC|nr:hypothetical protein [uncultured Psychromonas sp.]